MLPVPKRETHCHLNAREPEPWSGQICSHPLTLPWSTVKYHSSPSSGPGLPDIYGLQLQLPILVRGHILGFREIVLLNGVYPLLERGNIVCPQITDEVSFKVGAWLSGCVVFLVNSWVQRAQPYSRMKKKYPLINIRSFHCNNASIMTMHSPKARGEFLPLSLHGD